MKGAAGLAALAAGAAGRYASAGQTVCSCILARSSAADQAVTRLPLLPGWNAQSILTSGPDARAVH